MRDEFLDVPSPTVAAPPRRAAAPQLLIEMPAETAVRLLVRSLLEQLTQAANAQSVEAETAVTQWEQATRRLDACVALYAESLESSISGKGRRRIRGLARRSERAHRAQVHLAWLRRFLVSVPSDLQALA